MAHCFLAVLISIAVIMFFFRVRRLRHSLRASILSGLSILWVILFFLQFTLGAWTVWGNKAADIATAHVAVGAIMLSFGVSISAICWRISRRDSAPRCPDAPAGRPYHREQPE